MNQNRIYIGPPGSGKTYSAKKSVVEVIWESLSESEKNDPDMKLYNPDNFCDEAFNYIEANYKPGIKLVSLHEGMTSQDFIEGIAMDTFNGITSFVQKDKIVTELANEVIESDKPGFLILDDIHRVNISSVLGELMYAFSNRGEYVTLASGKKLCIPENMYVFMTSNILHPEYNLDANILATFEVCYAESNEERLRNAIKDSFYKNAYFNIDQDLMKQFEGQCQEWNTLRNKYKDEEIQSSPIKDVDDVIASIPSFSVVFSSVEAEKFLNIGYPLKWTDSNTVRFKGEFNKFGGKLYKTINDICELYFQYYSEDTVKLLDMFIADATEKYVFYNSFLDYIAPDYGNEKNKYVIGFTYFLPGRGFSMWNAERLMQNKIKAQVLPLLRQYKKEGVVLTESIPDAEHTYSQYTRERAEVAEDKIEIKLNDEYRQIFLDMLSGSASAEGLRFQGGQKYNTNYGVLFEIIYDMVTYPLINNWEIMDLLMYDREIYYKLDEGQAWGSCLICNSNLSKYVRLGASDSFSGNDNGVYREDLHSIFYKGKKYFLVSKIKTETKARSINIDKCRLKKVVRREVSLYAMVKLLVYKYLSAYLRNLEAYKYADSSNPVGDEEILAVEMDLRALDEMSLHGESNDELRLNLLNDIRNLPTWHAMRDGIIKGVYKTMDNRYQSVMESTGIHQMILQGPPGTSKTYGVKEFLAEQAGFGKNWNEEELKNIQLVTKDDEYVLPTENVQENNLIYWDIIQFHPSYTYEDFVRGISVSASDSNISKVNGQILENGAEKYSFVYNQPVPVMYRTVNRTLGKMARIARKYYNSENPENSKKFYLVVDEINRANLATVFGELIYALEYRDSEVATPYTVEGDSRLQIPSNLYIVGTMNTADKSISSIDYAIRRRFLFFPLLPDIKVVFDKVRESWETSRELRLFHLVDRIFDIYMNTDDYNRADVQIGHTYFIRKSDEKADDQMRDRFLYQVIPVLREYHNDGILMDEVYGNEPESYEIKAFDIVEKMQNSSSPEKLEELYKALMDELIRTEYTESIKQELKKKNLIGE
ncbi:AAA domain (dynein-related subfamily) [Lachnospiraceae bacterium KH1T2]|nr:AAA domain (dynein-related subfamily) [Lachnospiraceae bacterium KH1T2]